MRLNLIEQESEVIRSVCSSFKFFCMKFDTKQKFVAFSTKKAQKDFETSLETFFYKMKLDSSKVYNILYLSFYSTKFMKSQMTVL